MEKLVNLIQHNNGNDIDRAGEIDRNFKGRNVAVDP